MKGTYRRLGILTLALAWTTIPLNPDGDAWAYVIGNWWPDADNIVMDDVFLPASTWSDPAQFQLSEWNQVDTTDNSHPFRINSSPQFSFGANDGDNTMGFLGEAGLNSEYGLSYASALAWAACWSGFFSGRLDECDVMLNPSLPWQLVPDDDNFFQSTVLHETGHVRGLNHYNNYLSMQNSGVNKKLRDEVLYMDDKEGVRQHASHVGEHDITIYRKWHNGSVPLWMTSSPTTARVGDTINFNNITVENRGTNAFGPLRFGTYLSTNDIISTGDQLLNTGSWGAFGRVTFSTFNWSAIVPSVSDCGIRYIGGIVDDNNVYSERFEGNNAVAFSNGSPTPQAFTILLQRDSQEPNDTFGTARAIVLPFNNGNLSIDQDGGQDFYRFTLAGLSHVDISLSFTHASGDVDVTLLNSSAAVLAFSTGTTNSESIIRDLAAGTYYIRVYGFGAGSCNRYAMSVSATVVTPPQTLTVTKAGTGTGTVTSAPAGITCGADCTEDYPHGTVVTLTPTPAAVSVFASWSGDADCSDGIVTMTAAKTCTATFNLSPPLQTLTVTKAGTGTGTVTSAPAGITCGADCTETYAYNTVVVLTPTPAAGSAFSGWSGNADCLDGAVRMKANKTCTATFNLPPKTLTVTKAGTGSGTVTSAPAGINCGADCTETYAYNTVVVLTPTPAAGSAFSGWSGNADCLDGAVRMKANKTCTATFSPAFRLSGGDLP